MTIRLLLLFVLMIGCKEVTGPTNKPIGNPPNFPEVTSDSSGVTK